MGLAAASERFPSRDSGISGKNGLLFSFYTLLVCVLFFIYCRIYFETIFTQYISQIIIKQQVEVEKQLVFLVTLYLKPLYIMHYKVVLMH